MPSELAFVSCTSNTQHLWARRALLASIITIPFSAQAIPSNMGTFNITTQNTGSGSASGTYTAAKSDGTTGATGTFAITRSESNGYSSMQFESGSNGIMIRNNTKQGTTADDKDKFTYTITLTPTDLTSIHTLKIAQASYSTGGNSEIARQTLQYTPNTDITSSAKATVRSNPSVAYYFGAMGDYFMGSKNGSGDTATFNSNIDVSAPQLRTDSTATTGSSLYYYNITKLKGAGTTNPHTLTRTTDTKYVSFKSTADKYGTLPAKPTFENILKSTSNDPSNQSTYTALSENTVISNGGSYVSFGITNANSDYVVAVENAKTVTLAYEGIMNGNSGVNVDVVGETYTEWLSFGVESTPYYYLFSGTVFNDNGGNTTPQTSNAGYFNGVFDTASETGITGSTVKLVDCNNTSTVYTTENIAVTDTGKYQLRIPITSLSGNSNVCLIETNSESTYPVRTTTNIKTVALVAGTYTYDNNNFGRVSSDNVALTLKKYQYVHTCDESLDYTAISTSDTQSPTQGFSMASAQDVEAGQCIAYKITATNRANIAVSNLVVQDILQEKGVSSATVTSKLAAPLHNSSDYSADSVAIGDNGLVKTNALTLAAKSTYDFYFNTKYGTTQSD